MSHSLCDIGEDNQGKMGLHQKLSKNVIREISPTHVSATYLSSLNILFLAKHEKIFSNFIWMRDLLPRPGGNRNPEKMEVLPRFELGLLDSKSKVIAITP